MEWSDEMVMEFLHNYETEAIIWDPKNVNHKKKHLVADAWRRLKNNLSYNDSTTIEELKKKRDSLMAYYRINLNKIKNSNKSGMGTEESFKTNWFAFSAMNSFLAPIYECSATINTEEPIEKKYIAAPSSTERNQTVDSTIMINKKKRQQGMPDLLHAKKQMDEAFSMIKERATLNKPEMVHECDIYAQLLASRLKKMDEERRIILMHAIDSLVFQEIISAKAQERAPSVASSYSFPPQSNYDNIILSTPNSPLTIIHPSSPTPQTVQSTQAVLSAGPVNVLLQSQQPSLQPINLSHDSISVQSHQPRKIIIVSQKIIHPGEAYYNIFDTMDSEQE